MTAYRKFQIVDAEPVQRPTDITLPNGSKVVATVGDWIITPPDGGAYPVDGQTFLASYEPVIIGRNGGKLFSEALEAARKGRRIRREGWNGKNMSVFLVKNWFYQAGGDTRERNQMFLCLQAADGTFTPWTISQADVLADDWQIGE